MYSIWFVQNYFKVWIIRFRILRNSEKMWNYRRFNNYADSMYGYFISKINFSNRFIFLCSIVFLTVDRWWRYQFCFIILTQASTSYHFNTNSHSLEIVSLLVIQHICRRSGVILWYLYLLVLRTVRLVYNLVTMGAESWWPSLHISRDRINNVSSKTQYSNE